MGGNADLVGQLRRNIEAIEQGSQNALAAQERTSPAQGFNDVGRLETQDPNDVQQECFDQSVKRAYQKILRMASTREQSSARVRKKLEAASFEEQVIEAAMERAVRMGAIDDKRYAESLVRSTYAAGKGLRNVKRQLDELGVDPLSLDAYRDLLDKGPDDQLDRALALLRQKPPHAKNKRESAYRKLVTSGYEPDIASQAARIFSEQQAP